ncbi:hypothetical protein HPB49_022846 [Dermacentor silvarum]|uniref:Uncharacterized protein n=1 Tax=Dermacentor silvarum TaxID=543639 RepID=A0ACB8CHX3_DERSI|nr:hypothetical protein HPB49_022846 [Dermacentor silvarum]
MAGKLSHPPYIPDLSPPGFDLYPKLESKLEGVRYKSLDKLSMDVTRVIRQLPKDFVVHL